MIHQSKNMSEPSGTLCDPSTLQAKARDSRLKASIGYKVRLCLRATKQTPQHKTKVLLLFRPSGRCSPVVFKTVEMRLSELTVVQTALFNETQLLEHTEGRRNS